MWEEVFSALKEVFRAAYVIYLFSDKELVLVFFFLKYVVNDASAALEIWDEIKSENCDFDFVE